MCTAHGVCNDVWCRPNPIITTTTQPPHNHHTTTTQPPHNHHTTTTQPPHNHHTTTTQPPHNHHTTTTQQPHNNYTTTTQQLHNNYTTKTTQQQLLQQLQHNNNAVYVGVACFAVFSRHFSDSVQLDVSPSGLLVAWCCRFFWGTCVRHRCRGCRYHPGVRLPGWSGTCCIISS